MRVSLQLTPTGLLYRLEGDDGRLVEAPIDLGAEPVPFDDFALRLKSSERAARRELARPVPPAPEPEPEPAGDGI